MTLSGTSMATPHVTGAVALLRGAYPKETYQSVISRLYSATDKLLSLTAKCTTGGRLNIGRLFPLPATNIEITGIQPTSDGILRVSVNVGGGSVQIESSSNLKDWNSLSQVPAVMNATETDFDVQVIQTQRFFRVRTAS